MEFIRKSREQRQRLEFQQKSGISAKNLAYFVHQLYTELLNGSSWQMMISTVPPQDFQSEKNLFSECNEQVSAVDWGLTFFWWIFCTATSQPIWLVGWMFDGQLEQDNTMTDLDNDIRLSHSGPQPVSVSVECRAFRWKHSCKCFPALSVEQTMDLVTVCSANHWDLSSPTNILNHNNTHSLTKTLQPRHLLPWKSPAWTPYLVARQVWTVCSSDLGFLSDFWPEVA